MRGSRLWSLIVLMTVLSHAATAQETGGSVQAEARFGRLTQSQDLWSGPGDAFRIMRRVDAGNLCRIIGESGSYYRVELPDSFPCYVHRDYIRYGADMVGTITGSVVNLRSIPGIEGDYAILKVERGDVLFVWEPKGEWVRVVAPRGAFGYFFKSSVEPVPPSPAIEQEYEAVRQRGHQLWIDQMTAGRADRNVAQEKQGLKSRLDELEKNAAGGFDGKNLAQIKGEYEALLPSLTDENDRRLVEARISAIDTLLEKQQMEQSFEDREARMRMREERWREAQKKLEKQRDSNKQHSPAETPAIPALGGRLNVLGKVDASGSRIVLRGGRDENNPLYAITCPDRRFKLKDFAGLRIAVKGRVEKIVIGELPVIAVERIEILR